MNCGYNLRGLVKSGSCPECSWPVRRSLGGPLLRHGSQAHLERLWRGLWLLHRGSVLAAILLTGIWIVFMIAGLGVLLGRNGMVPSFDACAYASVCVFAAWGIASLAGLVLIVLPNPQIASEDRTEPLVTRILLPLGPVITLAWVAILIFYGSHTMGAQAAHFILFALLWAFGILLDRWLDRIEARIEPIDQQPQPWPFDTVVWRTLVTIGGELGLIASDDDETSHHAARRACYLGPAGVLTFALWMRHEHGPHVTGVLVLTLIFPISLLLTLGRMVRGVRHERDLARLPEKK